MNLIDFFPTSYQANSVKRVFYANYAFSGCPSDSGWFMVVDRGAHGACGFDSKATKPFFLYSPYVGICNVANGRLILIIRELAITLRIRLPVKIHVCSIDVE